jgi:ATP-binding cassette subfamily C (CFTR/MRP) protein 4
MVVVLLGLVAPVQLAIITGLLWKEIGAFALLPLGTFLFSFPFVGLLNKNYGNLVHKAKLATDSRLKLVREFISAIRIVKYYAWERAFEKNIGEFRDREVNRIKDTTFIRVAGVSVFAAVSPISTGLLVFAERCPVTG